VEQKKEGKGKKNKADAECKRLLDRFVAVAGGTGESTEESATSSTQVVLLVAMGVGRGGGIGPPWSLKKRLFFNYDG